MTAAGGYRSSGSGPLTDSTRNILGGFPADRFDRWEPCSRYGLEPDPADGLLARRHDCYGLGLSPGRFDLGRVPGAGRLLARHPRSQLDPCELADRQTMVLGLEAAPSAFSAPAQGDASAAAFSNWRQRPAFHRRGLSAGGQVSTGMSWTCASWIACWVRTSKATATSLSLGVLTHSKIPPRSS